MHEQTKVSDKLELVSPYFAEQLVRLIVVIAHHAVDYQKNKDTMQNIKNSPECGWNPNLVPPGTLAIQTVNALEGYSNLIAVVALRSSHGRFLTAQPESHGQVVSGYSPEVGPYETFAMRHVGKHKVVFQTYYLTHLRARPDGSLKADAPQDIVGVEGVEFTLVDLAEGWFAFRSAYGKYITASPQTVSGQDQLTADRDTIGGWQWFRFQNPDAKAFGLGQPPENTNTMRARLPVMQPDDV